MRIEVDTKFNIGDMVYVPEPYVHWIPNPEPLQVTGIKIKYRLENGGKMNQIVLYEVVNEFLPVDADMCFATFEECKQWCWEQNEKEGW